LVGGGDESQWSDLMLGDKKINTNQIKHSEFAWHCIFNFFLNFGGKNSFQFNENLLSDLTETM
jgi:hypothetical protein